MASAGKSQCSAENPDRLRKNDVVSGKIESSAENLKLLARPEKFCDLGGFPSTFLNFRLSIRISEAEKPSSLQIDCVGGYLDFRPEIRLAGDGIPKAAGSAKQLMKNLPRDGCRESPGEDFGFPATERRFRICWNQRNMRGHRPSQAGEAGFITIEIRNSGVAPILIARLESCHHPALKAAQSRQTRLFCRAVFAF
jgi:hypothetical protein